MARNGSTMAMMAVASMLAACDPKAAGSTGSPAPAASADGATVFCAGVNACSGKSECKTAKTACAGKNSCKGEGVLSMSAADCKQKGGTAQAKLAM